MVREAGEGRRRMESTELLGRDTELIIAHGAEEYRLRLTRQGKLILTK
jgi:hemin uptake protein HemP